MMRCFRRKPHEKGIVIILVAILMVVIVGMAALAVDVGQLFIARQKAQNTCDAAALAGIWDLVRTDLPSLSDRKAAATQTAIKTALGNNEVTNWRILIPGSETPEEGISVEFPTTVQYDDGTILNVNEGEAIRVRGEVLVNFGFARIFGFDKKRVEASATAIAEQIKELCSPLKVPIGVSSLEIFNEDGSVNVKFGTQETLRCTEWNGGFLGPGNYLSLRLDEADSGAKDYRMRLAGDKPTVCLSTEEPNNTCTTEPGKMGNATYTGIMDRLAKEEVYTNDDTAWAEWTADFNPETGMYPHTWRIIILPVLLDFEGIDDISGSKEVTIVGFIGFFIEKATHDGQDKGLIIGRFIQGAVIGDKFIPLWNDGSSLPGSNNWTMIRLRLIY